MPVLPLALAACAGVIAGLATGLCVAAARSEPASAPAGDGAYMIVTGTVHDRERLMADYSAYLPPLYARHGGRYLALTGEVEVFEGEAEYQSVVLSAWPSIEAARAFWNDRDYRELAQRRIDGGWGDFNVVAFEALPQ